MALAAACLLAVAGAAQDDDSAADVTRMVDGGMVEALEARFSPHPSIDQLRVLAIAGTHKAAQQTADDARDTDFRAARKRYDTWIAAIEHDTKLDATKRDVDAAGARIALATMILTQWAANDLDRNTITDGRFDQADRLDRLLRDAGALLNQALTTLAPLNEAIERGDSDTEERFLALGIYDAVRQQRLEAQFRLAHCRLYLASLPKTATKERLEALRDAERLFQTVINAGIAGAPAARAQLGLAITLCRQGRYDEARQYYEAALKLVDEGPLAARTRVERARCEIDAGRFQEARLVLAPLVQLDPDHLPADQQSSLFYINLAHLWDANSYLLEAELVISQATDATARQAVARRAQAIRDQGLTRMNRLAARGGPWPELVNLYVGPSFNPDAPIDALSPAELLFAARDCTQRGEPEQAQQRLRAAEARGNLDEELAGEILFELATSLASTDQTREAAQLFDRLVREHPRHAKAEQAATQAYQLWARIAEQSGQRDDYLRLSDALRALLRHFPKTDRRLDAAWWLPLALQRAGEYEQAAAYYASVPAKSPHWEEARYRRVVCRRLAWQADPDHASAERIASELRGYAVEAYSRATNATDPAQVRRWAAQALIQAAEVWLGADDGFKNALSALDAFDVAKAAPELTGRALAVRIRALRGLNRLDEASAAVRDALDRLSPDESAPVLALLADSVLGQLDRLEAGQRDSEAASLARSALGVFERLAAQADDRHAPTSQPVAAARQRQASQDAQTARYALARVQFAAGHSAEARDLIEPLVKVHPNNGDYCCLHARVLTALLEVDGRIPRDADPHACTAAKTAWARLLDDPQLRQKAPQRYWEARYQFLRLLLAEGKAAEVAKAIEQERVWRPALGGAPWSTRLEQLLAQARRQAK